MFKRQKQEVNWATARSTELRFRYLLHIKPNIRVIFYAVLFEHRNAVMFRLKG
jgi:two-component SAPR family response regulator